jgi:Na+-transporting NADH:ubiquinone oxidoreductase subunit NqrB
MIFRSGDCSIWNADGYRSNFIIWVMILAGVVKQAISRCLIVMVSLGWGVVRDSLGSTMSMIVILGTIYVIASAVCDFSIVFAVEDTNRLSKNNERELIDFAKLMNYVVAFVDVVFVMWILDALNNTMIYLENMSQARKLDRFLKLRFIILIAVVLAVFRGIFIVINNADDQGIIAEEHAWAVQAAEEFIYLFVLIGVAYLWRPNPNAKEYAYVMELPAMGEDGDTDLELTGVVPSAADTETAKKAGFVDDFDDNSNFKIT